MSYPQCSGTSLHPQKGSVEYKMISGVSIAVHGKCRHCGKRCALTMAGNIWAHKKAEKEILIEALQARLKEVLGENQRERKDQ